MESLGLIFAYLAIFQNDAKKFSRWIVFIKVRKWPILPKQLSKWQPLWTEDKDDSLLKVGNILLPVRIEFVHKRIPIENCLPITLETSFERMINPFVRIPGKFTKRVKCRTNSIPLFSNNSFNWESPIKHNICYSPQYVE